MAAARAPMRLSRGVAFAGTALGLGIVSHLAGGGRLPNLTTMILLAVPVAWISFFLTHARRRWPMVVSCLLVIEAGLHAGLSLLSGPGAHLAPIQVAGEGQMMMGADSMAMTHITMTVTTAGDMSQMIGMPLIPSFGMIVAHLTATALTGAVLAYGEHLLWCLWTLFHHVVTIFTDLVELGTPPALMATWLLTVSPVPVLVNRSVRRRGPPQLVVGLPASA